MSNEENIRAMIAAIGEDPEREGLKETPSRVIRSWERLYGGYKQNPKDLIKTFTEFERPVEGLSGKAVTMDDMVILRDIEMFSMCEHHMLPFFGKAHIGYIPGKQVIGVSKLARLLECFARRLQIQERIGHQVTDALMSCLAPKGAACVIEAQHFCMKARGVEKQNSVMVTSSMRGVFRDNRETRNEFLTLIREK